MDEIKERVQILVFFDRKEYIFSKAPDITVFELYDISTDQYKYCIRKGKGVDTFKTAWVNFDKLLTHEEIYAHVLLPAKAAIVTKEKTDKQSKLQRVNFGRRSYDIFRP